MSNGDLSNFFYNLIPGALFLIGLNLLGLNYLTINGLPSDKNGVEQGIILIILALFLGFIFQGLTKLLRECKLNKYIFSKVMEKNPCHKKALKTIKDETGLASIDTELFFYLMDDYLRAKNMGAGPIHFSARFALWSNIFWASGIYMFIMLFFLRSDKPLNIMYPLTVCIFGFACYQSCKYFYAMYDVVLKAFIAVTSISESTSARK